MIVEVHELSLPGLDALAADGLALFIDQRERPLVGLAGLCDWRLCGHLSRVIATGFFGGNGGETLLMPTDGRLPVARLLAFGLGESGASDREAQLGRALEVAHRAGLGALALSIDFLSEEPEAAAAAGARVARRGGLARQVIVGDVKVLDRTLKTATAGLAGVELAGAASAAPAGQKRA